MARLGNSRPRLAATKPRPWAAPNRSPIAVPGPASHLVHGGEANLRATGYPPDRSLVSNHPTDWRTRASWMMALQFAMATAGEVLPTWEVNGRGQLLSIDHSTSPTSAPYSPNRQPPASPVPLGGSPEVSSRVRSDHDMVVGAGRLVACRC